MTVERITQNQDKIKDTYLYRKFQVWETAEELTAKDVMKGITCQILLGTNSAAKKVLDENGISSNRKDGMYDFRKLCESYGVSEDYVFGVCRSYRISSKGFPGDFVRFGGSRTTVSAKIALVLCCLMYYGRRIPMGSRVSEVYKSIFKTKFYGMVANRSREIARNKLAKESGLEKFTKLMTPGNEDLIQIGDSGKLEISLMNLAKLIKNVSATMEIIENVSPAITKEDSREERRGNPMPVVAHRQGVSKRFRSQTECARYIGTGVDQVSVAIKRNGTVHGYKVIPA